MLLYFNNLLYNYINIKQQHWCMFYKDVYHSCAYGTERIIRVFFDLGRYT